MVNHQVCKLTNLQLTNHQKFYKPLKNPPGELLLGVQTLNKFLGESLIFFLKTIEDITGDPPVCFWTNTLIISEPLICV